jgi:pimeloyl-ACP methyl ester carboxylesterase
VRGQIGAGRPLVLIGYSNGGALITKYALDALEDASLPPPTTLILLSPMIGVSQTARLTGALRSQLLRAEQQGRLANMPPVLACVHAPRRRPATADRRRDSIYSLSHVALPFPIDDPIYGGEGRGRELGSVSLGRLSARGEKGVLIVPAEVLMRMTWNPFFPYLARRVERWVIDAVPR